MGPREIFFSGKTTTNLGPNMAQLEHLRVRHLTLGEREALQEGIPTIERALDNRGQIDVNRDPSALAVLETFWQMFNSRIQVRRLIELIGIEYKITPEPSLPPSFKWLRSGWWANINSK